MVSSPDISHIFTKNNKINTALITKEKFLKSSLYQQIVDATLHIPGSISEKIYCYVNRVIEPVKCSCCNNPVKFKTFQTGYTKFCSIKCSRQQIIWKSSSKRKKEITNY